MNQIIIFSSIYLAFFIYAYKTNKFGSFLLFIYKGLYLLISAILIEDAILKQFLLSDMICNILILLGILIIKKKNIISDESDFTANADILKKIFLIFGIFIFYHYYMTGIPFLSENIHTLRFNLRSSGLFGVPSRLAVYGITILFMITLFSFEKNIFRRERIIVYFLIILIFTAFQSSKSSLVPIFYYLMLCYPFIISKKKFIYSYKNFIFFIFITSIYFLFIFDILGSINNLNVLDYLIFRSTVVTYDSGIFLIYNMSHNDFNFAFNNALLNDLLYPIFTLFSSEVTTLNEQLSRALYGNYTGSSVPVTPGWFAYHNFIFKYSYSLTYLYSLFFGFFIGFLENKTFKSNLLVSRVTLLASLYWLWGGYSKGNLYYIILNLLLCLSIVYAINIFFKKTTRQ
tara:strand:- start:1449 stop:2651 length:1203 start_codon:yes stop_codon:yes gene_type:complete